MKAIRLQALFAKLALVILVGFMLLVAGVMTALLPQLAARLMLIPLLFIMVFLAVLSQTNQPLNENFLKIWLAILLATMALWPTYLIFKFGGLPSIDARKIVAGLSLAAMLFFIISRKQIFRALTSENVGSLRIGSWLITAYAVWRIASCFVSPAPIPSLIQVFWEVLYYYSMFFVGALFFSRRNLHEWCMKVFMILAVLIACYAGIEWIMQKNLLSQLAPANEEFAELKLALSLSRERDGFFRSQSTFEHPLLLAEFSAMAVCFGLAAMLWSNKVKGLRALGAITLLSAIAAALFSGSRSALITVISGGGLVFMLWLFSPKQQIHKGKQSFRKIAFVMMMIASLAVALPTATLLVQGKSRSETSSTAGRVYMLEQGLSGIEKSPLMGNGPGTAGMIAGIRTGNGISTLDNYFLAIAIESGVPAFLLLLACLLYPVGVIFNRLLSGVQISVQFYAAVAGSLVVIVITRTVLWMPYNLTFAFIFAGMALSSLSTQFDNSPNVVNK